MDKNLHDYRKSYEKGSLTEDTVLENPLKQFATWFVDAEKTPTVEEPNAMTLSTVDTQGVPKARVVLLKEFTQEGFVFYTNYTSGKAQAIAQNNKVCISFFWPSLERQIIITGMAVKISEEKSIAYFNKRPRESQLGALVSDQSTSIDSRVALEEKLLDLEKQYQTKPLCVSVSLLLCVSVRLCVSVSPRLCLCLCVFVFMGLSVSVSLCPCLCLCV